jgi:hypothetical protein
MNQTFLVTMNINIQRRTFSFRVTNQRDDWYVLMNHVHSMIRQTRPFNTISMSPKIYESLQVFNNEFEGVDFKTIRDEYSDQDNVRELLTEIRNILDQRDENVEKRLFDYYNQQMELKREFILPFRGELIGDTVNTTNDIYVPDLQNNEEQDRIIAIEASSIDPIVPSSSNSSIVILPSRNVTVVGENKNVSIQRNKENLNSSSLE